MKIIIYDHRITFNTVGRKMHFGLDGEPPLRIKSGDTFVSHHTVETSIWVILYAWIFRKDLTVDPKVYKITRHE